jgi:AAA family ATP:ADP antiporter
MSADVKPEFSKWRAFFWPVHAFELKKIIPMLLMFFFISFNYTILRDTKDTLLVTSSAGAEAIPFVKVWGVVPAAILFTLIYAKLSNILSRENLFYVTITPFLIFFALFVTVLYPNFAALQPNAFADSLKTMLPPGAAGFVESIRNWPFGLFYILAELWGSVVLSLLFWAFANDTTKVSEAKRFYALFGLGANLALVVSGPTIVLVSNIRDRLPPGVDAWQVSLNYLMSFVVIAGLAVIGMYWWINRHVLTDTRFFDATEIKARKTKPKMSIGESLAYLAKSRYILCIAALVICYGICINLVEVTWKSQLKLQYPNQNDYSRFMGYFSFCTGLVTIFMMLFVGGNAMRKSWGFAAILTPIVLLITGTAFFVFVLFRGTLADYFSALGTTPLFLAVIFGAIQNIMSKSSKYSLFDPTKETAYIPLDPESKVKGKAAIDVIGARLGKSGGSLIQQGLLIACGSIGAITPYIAVILFGFIAIWILAVRSLSKQFAQLTTVKVTTAA